MALVVPDREHGRLAGRPFLDSGGDRLGTVGMQCRTWRLDGSQGLRRAARVERSLDRRVRGHSGDPMAYMVMDLPFQSDGLCKFMYQELEKQRQYILILHNVWVAGFMDSSTFLEQIQSVEVELSTASEWIGEDVTWLATHRRHSRNQSSEDHAAGEPSADGRRQM